MKKRFRNVLACILLTFAVVQLTGCAGSKAANSLVTENAAAVSVAETTAAAPMAGASKSESDSGLNSSSTVQPVTAGRKLIRNINLNVETTSFDTLISSLAEAVTGFGGYMEQSDISGNSMSYYNDSRHAYLTARIPSNRLDSFITQVEEQGNITNKSETTQDVTLQYSDIESRKKSLTIEQERLWALLEKADTLEAVIALESRLSEIRYQLEAFESQLRTFDNQVDYSTVYMNISEVKVFTPTTPDSVIERIQKGFDRNLSNVTSGMVDFFVWLVSSLPVLILLAAIAAIAYLLIRFANRRYLKKRPGKKQQDRKRFWNKKASARPDDSEDTEHQDQQTREDR